MNSKIIRKRKPAIKLVLVVLVLLLAVRLHCIITQIELLCLILIEKKVVLSLHNKLATSSNESLKHFVSFVLIESITAGFSSTGRLFVDVARATNDRNS